MYWLYIGSCWAYDLMANRDSVTQRSQRFLSGWLIGCLEMKDNFMVNERSFQGLEFALLNPFHHDLQTELQELQKELVIGDTGTGLNHKCPFCPVQPGVQFLCTPEGLLYILSFNI